MDAPRDPPAPPTRKPTEDPGGHSTIGALAARGQVLTTLRLREDPLDRDTGVFSRPGALDTAPTNRYQILGEVAQGGVGVVLKVRDADLGRDVAMKVLRDEYQGRTDLSERFVEEAQIGGQLQHPGVVPVYEMGLQEGKRLYFTMKLVKGRTLAALLAERRSPEED